MWMMGCRDSSSLNTSDSINGRKLRPLIPRPTSFYSSSAASTTTTSITTTSSPISRIHGSDLLSLHSRLGTMEYGKRELTTQPVSSRWNPTPEQLRTLEDLYRQGTRTPNAEQIQYITAQLRGYGKIEGKNVFYWFQNHKARERQKRKRRIEMAAAMGSNLDSEERKDLADTSRKAFEGEGYKSWPSPTNRSTLAQVCMQTASHFVFFSLTSPQQVHQDNILHERSLKKIEGEKKGFSFGVGKCDDSKSCTEASFLSASKSPLNSSLLLSPQESRLASRSECKREAWLECSRDALNYVSPDRKATWQMMQLCTLPCLISTTSPATSLSNAASAANTAAVMNSMLTFNEDFDVGGPPREPSRTLELFPLHSDGVAASDKMSTAATMAGPSDFCSYHFIQFLPLKN